MAAPFVKGTQSRFSFGFFHGYIKRFKLVADEQA